MSQTQEQKTYEVKLWGDKIIYLSDQEAEGLMEAIVRGQDYVRINRGMITTKIEYCIVAKPRENLLAVPEVKKLPSKKYEPVFDKKGKQVSVKVIEEKSNEI